MHQRPYEGPEVRNSEGPYDASENKEPRALCLLLLIALPLMLSRYLHDTVLHILPVVT